MKIKTTLYFITILLIGCGENKTAPASAPSLPVLEIISQTATVSTEFPAAVQGLTDVEIRPQVSGTIDDFFVDEGAYVTKGQSLLKINDNPYREQYNNALATLNAAEAATINAQLEEDKLIPLFENKVISEYMLKTAKANLKIAKANVARSKAALANAQIDLGYTLIKAPANGYLGRFPKKKGSLISPSDIEALTKLSDISSVYAYFSLGENDFIHFKSQHSGSSLSDKLKRLPPVSLVLADNSLYTEKGKIDMINGQFDKNTGAITLRAVFPNKLGLLRSGNTGKVKLDIEKNNAILVPQEATFEIQDKIFVFVVNRENKTSKQPVKISGVSGSNYLIENGVKPGDRIILKGFENLQEGDVINPEINKKPLTKITQK